MNKQAQSGLGIAIIVAIMIFLVGMSSINIIKGEVTNSRSSLNCSSPSSDGTKLVCLVVDWVIPYFIVLILSISGGVVVAKLTI